MTELFIPAKTAEELANPAGEGGRNQQAIRIAVSLIGNGFSPQAVFAELRSKYADDVTDKELEGVVTWAVNKNPSPSGFGKVNGNGRHKPFQFKPTATPTAKKEVPPAEHAAWWLGNHELSPDKFCEASPLKIPESPIEAVKLMFELIYGPEEDINIVRQFTETDGKSNPQGSGKTLSRPEWVDWFATKGIPQSEAGAWIRPNPCLPIGSGSNGAITDADTTHHRFLLLESDVLPLPQQLALYSKLKIPISVVVSSGGKSVHAWARVDAESAEQYREMAKRILAALAPFGIDQANKNSSRLSRLSGAVRTIGASGDGLQRLLWLNPKVVPFKEPEMIAFEESLLVPVIQDKPLKAAARLAVDRYEDLIANQGKLGVPTSISDFDRDSGGLKAGNFVVVAGETGGGKSTLVINFINHALAQGVGVALFTLEMDKDEIMDALVSLNCRVNRNAFNTGKFTDGEIVKITSNISKIGNFPLWIYDSSLATVEEIRTATMQLVKDGKIGMVVVDYVQLINSSEYPNSREQQIAGISRSLRSLAKEAKLPLIGISQLNEEGKLRESRVLAHEAHIVMIVDDIEGESPRLKIVKGRRIPRRNYDLYFQAEYGLIASASKIKPEDTPQPTRNYDSD